MGEKSATTNVVLTLGGIGLVIHLLFLHWSMFGETADTPGQFVNNLLANVSLGLLGGLFYALLLRFPVTECIRKRKILPFALFKGAVLGAVASVAAFQGLYLGAACFLTYKAMVGVPGGGLKDTFLLAIMEIETYGLFVLFFFLIPVFVCGALVTAVVARSLFQPKPVGIHNA